MNRLDHTSFELLLEGFFKIYWYGSAGCLLWCNRWICMDVVWLTWKSAYSFKEFWIQFFDLLLGFDNLDFLFCVFLLQYGSISCNYGCRIGYYGSRMGSFCVVLLFYGSRLCMYLFLWIICCTWDGRYSGLGFTSRSCNWNTVSHDKRTLPSTFAM